MKKNWLGGRHIAGQLRQYRLQFEDVLSVGGRNTDLLYASGRRCCPHKERRVEGSEQSSARAFVYACAARHGGSGACVRSRLAAPLVSHTLSSAWPTTSRASSESPNMSRQSPSRVLALGVHRIESWAPTKWWPGRHISDITIFTQPTAEAHCRRTGARPDPGLDGLNDPCDLSQQKSTFPPQSIFYPLFLNEDGRIREKRLSKLHYRFRRYSTLPKTVLHESQYLQSYESNL